MSDSLCDAVDIYLTGVHNMHVRILHGRGVSGRRRHEACDTRYRGPCGGAPVPHGLHGGRRPGRRPGPVGGRDRPDHRRHRQGQLRLAAGRDHRLEPGPPRPEGHPAAAARGGQRPAGPAGRQPAGQERPVRRHRHGRHLDRRVRLERLDHPPAAEPVPARRLPQASRRHRHVPGPPVRGARLQQRGSPLLPQGHPRQGGPAAPQDLGPAAAARQDRGAQVRALRVRRHVRPVRGAHRQLRDGRPVGRGVDSLPGRHQGHRRLGPGAAGPAVPGERVQAGLDPQGHAHLRGGVIAGRVRGRQVPVPRQLA